MFVRILRLEIDAIIDISKPKLAADRFDYDFLSIGCVFAKNFSQAV